MSYGSLGIDILQSSTTGTPTQFQDGSGNQIGTLCRAWARFSISGSTVTINAQFNISSITRTGTGAYTISFANAMPDANYTWAGFSQASGGSQIISGNNTPTLPTASILYVETFNANVALVDPTTCGIAVFR